MPRVRHLKINGLNTYLNPLIKSDGDLIRAVNVESYPFGAKRKRPGYTTFLNNPDSASVKSLFSWQENDGTTLHLYRASGTSLHHSDQGTANWGHATDITSGSAVGYAILDNKMIVGDGAGSTKHTSDGTAFTDTTLAPVSPDLVQYQNRIYALGTSSTCFYSTTGDLTNWNTGGTSDSSSFTVPGEGKLSKGFVAADKLNLAKNSGLMYRWDGSRLVDSSTREAPTSPYSVDEKEGYHLWVNESGIMGYGGVRPEALSPPIQSMIYNDAGNGISGANLKTAPGVVHKYDYLLAVGTVTDDIWDIEYPDCILKFNFQHNEFLTYKFADVPTAWHSFKDEDGDSTLIFGDSSGATYEMDGTATTDNGEPIEAIMEFVLHLGNPELKKVWRTWVGFFNPGCQAQVQVALADTFERDNLKWVGLGAARNGVVRHKFIQNYSEGRLLFVRIKENSRDARFRFYGMGASVEGERI